MDINSKHKEVYMKSIYSKLWLKITSIILFVVFTVVFVASVASVALLAYLEVYFDGGKSAKSDVMNELANEEKFNFINDYNNQTGLYYMAEGNHYGGDSWEYVGGTTKFVKKVKGYSSESTETLASAIPALNDSERVNSYLDSIYSRENTDYAIKVTNVNTGEILYQNFSPEDYVDTVTTTFNSKSYGQTTHISTYFTTYIQVNEYLESLTGGIYNSSITYNSDIVNTYSERYYLEADYIPVSTFQCEVTVYIPSEYTVENLSTFIMRTTDFAIANRYLPFVTGIVSLILMIVIFIYLVCAAGHKAGIEGITPNFIDKIPFDLYLVIITALVGTVIAFYDFVWYNDLLSVIFWICAGVVFLLLAIGIVMTLATRAKLSTVFSNTVIWKVLLLIWKVLKLIARFIKKIFAAIVYFFKNMHFAAKTAISLVFIAAFEIIMVLLIWSSYYYFDYMFFFIWLFGNAIILTVAIFNAIAFGKIKKCADELANGNSHAKVDPQYLFGSYNDCASSLNGIGRGIEQAVQERMRSERLKTELITNVSHDLKTPLTSIVNYVDILSKEDIQPEEAKEHVEILVRQSQRMKKLIDDLIEASKASSGATKTELIRSDLGMLLSQSVVEYEEKFKNADLHIKMTLPEKELIALIDGKLMWRVFDNILNNICKYTQPGTRVYITAAEKGNNIEIGFKNISRYELNISGDELMERFVRGDSSRSTEGSGLGLSIAKSLCTLQNSDLSIGIDGDLFKVCITVPKLSDEELINE